MNVKDFTYFLEHPTKVVEPIHTKHLEDIIDEYPYFQAARALHLKGLKNLNSYKYNKALKVTAAYTTDRDVLFEFITSKDFLQYDVSKSKIAKIDESNAIEIIEEAEETPSVNQIETIEKEDHPVPTEKTSTLDDSNTAVKTNEIEITEIDTSDTITAATTPSLIPPSVDKPLPQDKNDADQILDPKLFQSKKPSNTEEEEALDIGKPLTFNAKEKYSFSEWLSLASKNPLEKSDALITGNNEDEITEQQTEAKERSTEKAAQEIQEQKIIPRPSKKPKVKSEAIKKKYDRIDKFIASNPKIVPTEQSAVIDISKSSRIDHNELMTETLARVYLEQKKYKNAIQAYKILSLKYPEKSSFFADRIKAVEKLRKDNK
ncbi:hypothetical protein [Maribacter ulvicola]|uniref:Tetratricopeptide repeat-containing protein n=1 Tax=Maribacter ulvicola TaxID=228959 RepID=A0A1N6WFX2_9FLAO|nr:hypothetical protein [Maribacter ulvicola]SIQ88892.1 hypothetical protein SAMN05421797_10464 [Maribacter ulvicola]